MPGYGEVVGAAGAEIADQLLYGYLDVNDFWAVIGAVRKEIEERAPGADHGGPVDLFSGMVGATFHEALRTAHEKSASRG